MRRQCFIVRDKRKAAKTESHVGRTSTCSFFFLTRMCTKRNVNSEIAWAVTWKICSDRNLYIYDVFFAWSPGVSFCVTFYDNLIVGWTAAYPNTFSEPTTTEISISMANTGDLRCFAVLTTEVLHWTDFIFQWKRQVDGEGYRGMRVRPSRLNLGLDSMTKILDPPLKTPFQLMIPLLWAQSVCTL